MADCIECASYTKFNGGLCYTCYKNQGTDKAPVKETTPSARQHPKD